MVFHVKHRTMGEVAMRLGAPLPVPSSSGRGDFGFGFPDPKKESLGAHRPSFFEKILDALRASCPC